MAGARCLPIRRAPRRHCPIDPDYGDALEQLSPDRENRRHAWQPGSVEAAQARF
jgi:hypothetical protein